MVMSRFKKNNIKVFMYDENTTLWDYCVKNKIPYYRIVYRIKNNRNNLSIEELLKITKGKFNEKKSVNYVSYNNKCMSLNKALKQFFDDYNLTLTTHTSNIIKRAKKYNISIQDMFESYMDRTLMNYRRGKYAETY